MRAFAIRLAVVAMTAALALGVTLDRAEARSVLEKIRAGETIHIAFSNEPPFAYPGEQGEPKGFSNLIAIEVLKRLGAEDIEPVVIEWGSLIPGLNADRFDVITAGMYVLPARCENALFTEPLGEFAEAFLVKTGNPHELHSFEDVRDKGLTLVTGTGYTTVEHARRVGLAEEQIMQVPDLTSAYAALRGGRAQAISASVFAIKELAKKAGDDVEVASPFTAPEFTKGYSAYAFRQADGELVEAFNAEMKKFIGSPEMLEAVAEYGYGEDQLPPDDVTTEALCTAEG